MGYASLLPVRRFDDKKVSDINGTVDQAQSEMDSDLQDETENEIQNEQELVHGDAKEATNPDAALKGFELVVLLEGEEKSQWGFKALEQMMEIHLCRGNRHDFLHLYKQLVAYGTSAVKWIDFEKSVLAILDYVWTSSTVDADFVENFSHQVLDTLRQFGYEKTWYQMMLKLGKRYLERGDHVECKNIIQELKNYGWNAVDDGDLKKGAKLERYALEIQLQMALKEVSILPKLYKRALRVQPANPSPGAMGIIRECGGMVHLHQLAYGEAYSDFFEALRCYNETGNQERCIACLKYLGLSSMLKNSSINPFDCREARGYQNEEQVLAVAGLVRAHQAHNLGDFNKILEAGGQFLVEDGLIRPHIEVLQKHLASEELLPCERFLLEYMNTELQSPTVELEPLLKMVFRLDGGQRDGAKVPRIRHAFESYGVMHTSEEDKFSIRVHFSPVPVDNSDIADPEWVPDSKRAAKRRLHRLRFPFAQSSDYAHIYCALDEAVVGNGSPEGVWELPFSSDTFKKQLRWYLSYIVHRISALCWLPAAGPDQTADLPWSDDDT